MNPFLSLSLQDSLLSPLSALFTSFVIFLPRLLAALLVFFFGLAIAKWLRKLTIKGLEVLKLSKSLQGTPVEIFLKNAEAGKIESIIGSTVYWMLMLVVLHATFTVIGLSSISLLLDKVLGYVPSVISAIVVLFIGMILAGVVESLIKGAIRSVSGKSALLLGRVSSYIIMIIATMAALSELNIASQFINTLFTGFVIMFALAFGLAVGLGSKSVVESFMTEWYTKMKKEMKEKK
jgi:hypothetical protein